MMRYKWFWAILVCLVVSPVQAQNAPAEYNLKVTPAEVDLIGKGLGTQPFNDVAPLMGKLRQQVMEQQQPPAKPKADGLPEPEKSK